MAINRYLDIATAHLSLASRVLLADPERLRDIDPPIYVCPKEYGWIIFGWDYPRRGLPEDLEAVIRYAERNDCSLIALDRDADTVPSLPTYNWPR